MERCLKRILTLGEGESLPSMREDEKLKGKERRVTERSAKVLGKSLRWRFHGAKGLVEHRPKETVGRQRSLAQRLREYQDMHEESFLSSWLREDVEYTKGERENMNKEAKEERENIEHRQKENVGRQRSVVQGRQRLVPGTPSRLREDVGGTEEEREK